MFAGQRNMHHHQNSYNCSMEVKIEYQKQNDYKAEVLSCVGGLALW